MRKRGLGFEIPICWTGIVHPILLAVVIKDNEKQKDTDESHLCFFAEF